MTTTRLFAYWGISDIWTDFLTIRVGILPRAARLMWRSHEHKQGYGSMAEEVTPEVENTDAAKPAQESSEPDVDYKAKFEETLRESRKWESRAKENVEKAKQLDELQESQKTEQEKLNERLTAAEKAANEKAAELLRYQVGVKHGFNEQQLKLLSGASEDELEEKAAAILSLSQGKPSTPKPDPSVGPKATLRPTTIKGAIDAFYHKE